MSLDVEAFLEWLEEDVDGYYVNASRVAEEWPAFYEDYEMGPVTSKFDPETGEVQTPVRDFRHTVKYGQPLD